MFVRVYAVVRFSDENGFYGLCLFIYLFIIAGKHYSHNKIKKSQFWKSEKVRKVGKT